MNRTPTRIATVGAAALLMCLASNAAAQEAKPAPDRLDSLLQQLQKTDQKTWDARKKSMTDAAKAARASAAGLRAQQKQKQESANREGAAAKAIQDEIKKLADLRAMLTQLTFQDPAANGAAKNSPAGKLELALVGMRKLPAAAWETRTKAMQAKAKKHQDASAGLAKSAKTLGGQAAAKESSAKALDGELAKLGELQALVGKLQMGVLAKAPAKPPAKGTAKPAKAAVAKAPAKPAAKKPAPKKAMPKKAMPKKAMPKKPAAAKPAAAKPKQPASKQPAAMDTAKKASKPVDKPAPIKIEVEPDKSLLTYEDHVFAIFDEHCASCHEPGDPSGGLDLTTHLATIQGGSSGRTIKRGDADASRLYLLVSHQEKPTMPPRSPKIDKQLIETIRTWIQQGAPKDLAEAKKLAVARAESRRKAAIEARKAAAKPKAAVVMPENLKAVKKAYPENPGAMRTLAASPGAPLLAVPGFHQILLLHQDNLRELGVIEFPFGQVESLSFSQDGSTLIAAGGIAGLKGGAVLYDVRTGRELGRFCQRRDAVLSAAVSPDGSLVATGDTRRNVEVLRAVDGQSLWKERHEEWVTSVTFSPDGKLLASSDRAGFVAVREADNGREVHAMKAADGGLFDLAFSPNSGYLATAGADRAVSMFRMRDGRRIFRQQRHSDQTLCVTWRSPTHLISSGADGRILHWKTSGAREAELPRVRDWVYDVVASNDGKRIFTADWLGRLIALDVKTRKVLATVTPLAVSQ